MLGKLGRWLSGKPWLWWSAAEPKQAHPERLQTAAAPSVGRAEDCQFLLSGANLLGDHSKLRFSQPQVDVGSLKLLLHAIELRGHCLALAVPLVILSLSGGDLRPDKPKLVLDLTILAAKLGQSRLSRAGKGR